MAVDITTIVQYVNVSQNIEIGRRLIIAGMADGELTNYVPYRPDDRDDCRKAFGESKLTQSYWEALAQNAVNVQCIGIEDNSYDSIKNALYALDMHQYDIIYFAGIDPSNSEIVKLISRYIEGFSIFGNGCICIMSYPERSYRTVNDYYDSVISNIPDVDNPEFFAILAGDVIYNKNTKFEYITDIGATYAGYLCSQLPYINPTRKRLNGIEINTEFSDTQLSALASAGITSFHNTINRDECTYKAVTLSGDNNPLNIAHMRVANTLNQAIARETSVYVGESIDIITIDKTVSAIIDYYSQRGYFRECIFEIILSGRNEITIALQTIPNDTIHTIDIQLKVMLKSIL